MTFQIHETAAGKNPRKARQVAEEVKETKLNPQTMAAAMEAADGHPQRLEILDEDTVIVWNSREHKHAMQARRHSAGKRGKR